MKTIKIRLRNLFIFLSLIVVVSFLLGDIAYSEIRKLSDTSQTASPGYLNAAKQKTENILDQRPKKISLLKAAVEFFKNQFSVKLARMSKDTPKIKLKKKSAVKAEKDETRVQESENEPASEDESQEPAREEEIFEEAEIEEEPEMILLSFSIMPVSEPVSVGEAVPSSYYDSDSKKIDDGNDRPGLTDSNNQAVFTESMDNSFTGGDSIQQYMYIPITEQESKFFEYGGTLVLSGRNNNIVYALNLANLFKEMLKNKGYVDGKDITMQAQNFDANKILETDALTPYTDPSVPMDGQTGEIQAINVLANIAENPDETELGILDVLKNIIEQETMTENGQVKEAEENFMQMAVAILLAQALPDLLNDKDMAVIKSIFNSLNQERKYIVEEYESSFRAYYDNVKKVLAGNMPTLQLKSIISDNIEKSDLERLPSTEIDKILRRIKNINDKTEKEEYILRKESEYAKKYIEPGKMLFDQRMKSTLRNFSQRLYKVLEGANLAKEEKGGVTIDLSGK